MVALQFVTILLRLLLQSRAALAAENPGALPASGPPPALGEAPEAPSDHRKNKLDFRQCPIGKRVLWVARPSGSVRGVTEWVGRGGHRTF